MTPRRAAASAAVLAANLLCIAALLWATTERLHVRVVVSDDVVSGLVGPTMVQAAVPGNAAGQVGLFLQGADPHATIPWHASAPDVSSASPSALLFRLGAESAWTNVRVKNLDTGGVLFPASPSAPSGGVMPSSAWRPAFGDWFHHPLGGETSAPPGLALLGSPSWRHYQVDADLLRPRNAAGLLVLAPDAENGMLFYFRPENRDVMWFQVRDGQWYGPVAAAPYRSFSKDAYSSAQDVARLLLGGYPAAAALIVLIATLTLIEAAVRRRGLGTGRRARPLTSQDGTVAFGVAQLQRSISLVPSEERETSAGVETPGVPLGSSGQSSPREGASNPLSLWERLRVRASPSDSLAGRNGIAAPTRPANMPDGVPPPRTRLGRLPDVAGLVLAIGGLVLTLYVADAILQRMPHVQDSVAYLFQAKIFALGRLWVPTPPHPQFFVHEFVVMTPDGRWFGKYPPGWPLLLALGVLAGAPWVVNPICGGLGLLLLYLIGRDAYRPRVGLLAAVLGLAAPFLIFLSGSMMAHASGLLFALVGTWCFLRASRDRHSTLLAILAGLAFGMVFLIRPYSALLVAAPFVSYAVARVVADPADGLRRFLPAAAGALPLIAVFLADNKLYTGDFLYPPQQLWWSFDTVGIGPGHGPWGYTPLDAFNNTSRNLSELLEHGFGWPPFLTLSLAVVPFLARRARTWDWLFLLGFLAVVGGYALWWADGIMYGPRFYYEGFGFLVLLTARGVDVALDLGRRSMVGPASRLRASGSVAARAVVGLVTAGLIAYNVAFYLPGQWQLYHGYNYVSHEKLDAVAAAGIHHALVFADVGQTYEWWEYGMVFSANDPLLRGDVVFARDLGDLADRQLLADFPGRSVYRLDGTTVTAFPAIAQP